MTMVNIYLNDEIVEYEDWYMFEKDAKLYLTVVVPSGKKRIHIFEEWKVEPT